LHGRKRQVEHVGLSSSCHLSDNRQPPPSETPQQSSPNLTLPRRRPSFALMLPLDLLHRNKTLRPQPPLPPSAVLRMLLQIVPTFLANPNPLLSSHPNSPRRLHHLLLVYAISISKSLPKTLTSARVAPSVPKGLNKNSGTSSKTRSTTSV
jgi:hypothetical protein